MFFFLNHWSNFSHNFGNKIPHIYNLPHFFSPTSSAFPEYLDCDVTVIPAKYDFKPYAYGFQKDSPYLGLFNHYLKELREKG